MTAERPIACSRVVPRLPLLVGDDLLADEAGRLRAHLRDCVACRRQASAQLQAVLALRDAPSRSPVLGDDFFAGLHADVMARIDREAERGAFAGERRLARSRRVAAAAAAILLFVGGWYAASAASDGGLRGRDPLPLPATGRGDPFGPGLLPLGHESELEAIAPLIYTEGPGLSRRDDVVRLIHQAVFGERGSVPAGDSPTALPGAKGAAQPASAGARPGAASRVRQNPRPERSSDPKAKGMSG